MKKQFKFGVLGLMRGRAPLNSLRLFPEEAVVTAVVEKDPAVLEDARQYFAPETVVYDSYEAMLASGIDAVILCDYFHTHCRHAIQALELGIAVFSETTAAPSLGECVDLVECVERTGGKYMLLANCPYFKALQLVKKKMEAAEFGDLLYAEGEYVHPSDPNTVPMADLEHLHWRQTLPNTYYNMHSLGPLMYATNAMPRRVIGKAAVHAHPKRPTNCQKAFVITEMDNGAVYNSTGCVGVGTKAKWYRFAFQRGTMETKRLAEVPTELIVAGIDAKTAVTESPSLIECGAVTPEEYEQYGEAIGNGGHGGCDSVLFLDVFKYLRGEKEPFFDVYRSVALSATAILAWYSVLLDSKQLDIPDFRDPAQRDAVRGDYRTPFAEKLTEITLPCRAGDPFVR